MSIDSSQNNNDLLVNKLKSTIMQKSHLSILKANEILRFEVRNQGQQITYIDENENNKLLEACILSEEALNSFFEIIELQFNEIDMILNANLEVHLTIILSEDHYVGSAKLIVNEQIPHS